MSVYDSKFWKKNWDPGLEDIDPKKFEISFTDAIQGTFDEMSDKIALTFQGLEITFGELDKYANQFANMLIDNGFKKGDIVAVNLANIPEYPIAVVGVLRAGCVLSGVSPLMSEVQMHYQLSDLGTGGRQVALVTLDAIFEGRLTKIEKKLPQLKLVITTSIIGMFSKEDQEKMRAVRELPSGKVTPLEGKVVLDFHDDILAKYSTDPPGVKINPDDLAFIQYTGGTTGPPKGAMLTHKNIVSDLLIIQTWLKWEKGKGIVLSGFPFFHIAGITTCINCIYLGWMQCLVPDCY